jgi:hypothetical protein
VSSTYQLKGVSSLTVRNGDITLFLDVDDFAIEVHEPEDEIYSDYTWEPMKFKSSLPSYTIRSSVIPVDKDGGMDRCSNQYRQNCMWSP